MSRYVPILRWVAGVGLAFVLAVVITLGWFWYRMGQTPSWWSPANAAQQENITLGERLENQTLSTVHTLRDESSDEWSLVLDQEAMNAWFATRWPKWVRNQDWQWAFDLCDIHAIIEADGVRLALRPTTDGPALSLFVKPEIDEAGQLSVHIEEAAVGRLSFPVGVVAGIVAGEVDPDADVTGLLAGETIDPCFKSGSNGYVVRIVRIELVPGRLTLHCQTEKDH